MSSKRPKSGWRQYFTIKENGATAQCKYCPKVLKTFSNTTNLKQHMERKHSAIVTANAEKDSCATLDLNASPSIDQSNSEDTVPSPSTSGTMAQPAAVSTPKRSKPSGIEASFSTIMEFSQGGFRSTQITEAIVEMVCRNSLPCSLVEGIGFKKLMKVTAPMYKVPCRKTITTIIDGKYEQKKELIVSKIHSVNSVSLTIDEWKDMQLRSFMGVTLHYIENFEIVSFNIACEPLNERHTAEYLAEAIRSICIAWEIPDDKVVSVTTDNAPNIVKAVEILYGRAKHIRCIAHTLNLVVDNAVSSRDKKFLEKVRRIVTWYHQSGVGAQKLRQAQNIENIAEGKLKRLIGDVSTRWNSQLFMVERFVAMSGIVGSILVNHPYAPPMLQANEIVILKEMVKILKPFEKVTNEMSSEKFVSASKAIPNIKCLKEYIDTIRLSHGLTILLKDCLVNGIKKRFDNIQKVHLFSVATFLDPRFKKIHLDDGAALARTINFIKRNLNNSEPDRSDGDIQSATPNTEDEEDNIWSAHQKRAAAATVRSNDNSNISTSELDLYISTPLIDLKQDPLQVWKSYHGAYPKLSEMTCRHLLVLASPAPAERLFSKAGNTVKKTRSRILGKRLPKLLFLQSLPAEFW